MASMRLSSAAEVAVLLSTFDEDGSEGMGSWGRDRADGRVFYCHIYKVSSALQ